jgi:hypothetical protein
MEDILGMFSQKVGLPPEAAKQGGFQIFASECRTK